MGVWTSTGPCTTGDTTKPGLWTMDWTVDWTMDWAFLYELSCSTTICFATWLERDL